MLGVHGKIRERTELSEWLVAGSTREDMVGETGKNLREAPERRSVTA